MQPRLLYIKPSTWDEDGIAVIKNSTNLVVLVFLLMVSGFVGCEKTPPDESAEPEEQKEEYYSPYILTGEGELIFEKISFTDVGLNQPDSGPVEPFILETIAESLAYKMIAHEEIDFTPEVNYDRSLLDPSNHLFCDKDHLYIALWRGYDPDRWGYSLWSGCHEAQEFAWEEVLDPDPDQTDAIEWVDPLVTDIVESLSEAQYSGCYAARC